MNDNQTWKQSKESENDLGHYLKMNIDTDDWTVTKNGEPDTGTPKFIFHSSKKNNQFNENS